MPKTLAPVGTSCEKVFRRGKNTLVTCGNECFPNGRRVQKLVTPIQKLVILTCAGFQTTPRPPAAGKE